jgi:hypothetical protein
VGGSPRVPPANSSPWGGGGGGGGLGSLLAGFSPNKGISFLTISPKLLDIWPVLLIISSPIKTALNNGAIFQDASFTRECVFLFFSLLQWQTVLISFLSAWRVKMALHIVKAEPIKGRRN